MARPPANLIALCDGHGIGLVTVTGQILMAVHSNAWPVSFPCARRERCRDG